MEVAEIVEDVAEVVEDVTEVVRMDKVTKYHTCNACDKNFKTSQDLENHVGSKHVEKECDYCEKRFRNEHELGKHLKTCDKIGTANKVCNKCNKKFTVPGLVRHNPTCHGNDTEYKCPECGEIFNSSNGLEDHQDQQHEMETVRFREVCFHWRRGSCLKGNSCRFSHVGLQNKAGSNQANTKVAHCKNGASCEWLASKSCSFFYPCIGGQRPWVNRDRGQGGRQDDGEPHPNRNQTHRGRQQQNNQPDRPDCQYDGHCEAVPNCPNIHSLQVFPVFQGRRNPGGLRNQARRRN